MRTNVYHILAKPPRLEKWNMFKEEEALALELVRSGRLRIDADDKSNFVRFQAPQHGISMVFSRRELFDPLLFERTQRLIAGALSNAYPSDQLGKQVGIELHHLRGLSQKNIEVPAEHEMQAARLLIQSAEPAVIHLAILEKAEIFVSFSHVVGDVMDIATWKEAGQSSGLQSTDGKNSAIFVSCNGNPFAQLDEEKNKEVRRYGDGFPAMARLMVIAAQEIGHYADIKRAKSGKKIGRYSSSLAVHKPSATAKKARAKDIQQCGHATSLIYKTAIKNVIEIEKSGLFYEKTGTHKTRRWWIKAKNKRAYKRLLRQLKKRGMGFLRHMPKSEAPAAHIITMLGDMQFNLSPEADAYEGATEEITEAIACAEALARVPQQVVKWGHPVTKAMMPHLYHLYYGTVIPACVANYEARSGKTIPRKRTKIRMPIKTRITRLWQKWRKKRQERKEERDG